MNHKQKATNHEPRITNHCILITAGPTREYIDPVRYISNDSSGQMGFALAGAAAKMGFKVTLIAGPVSLETPNGVRRIDVISALDMKREVLKHAPHSNIIIMTAAVADWRPKNRAPHKIKKSISLSHYLTISLVKNPDILAEIGKKKKPGQIIVGFALETEDLEKNALKKMLQKNCGLIVANTAKNISAGSGGALILDRNGKKIRLPKTAKLKLARAILKHVLEQRYKH